ncbi:MAG: hypothetical protein ACU0BF_00785 [Paracoccaceae bacterium]
MTGAPDAGGGAGAAAARSVPLAPGVSLTDDESAALARVLSALGAEMGRDLGRVFAGMSAGLDLRAVMRLPDGTADLLYAQAHARVAAGDMGRATELFLALTLIDPSRVDAWLGLGICQRRVGSVEAARLAFETAAALDGGGAAAAFHLAELSLATGDRDGAARHLAAFEAAPASAVKARLAVEVERLSAAATG